MTTCTCTTPCDTCVCESVSDEVVQVYQELKDFISNNYNDIKSIIRDEMMEQMETVKTDDGNEMIQSYHLNNSTIQKIVKRYLLEATVNVWLDPQQYLIPKVSRDIILNILREVYIRGEAPWKVIYPSHRLHMKISVGEISFGIIYSDIKAFPEMEFTSYDDLFEGMDIVPNYKVFDRTPYGSVMNWFVNLDWIKFLQKSVNIAPSAGSDDYEVPIAEILKGWMIYRCIRMAMNDIILTEKPVELNDRYYLYKAVYILSKIIGKAFDDNACALGFKKKH